jgi:glycosyltransferase involved in cell wall biosynthesis
VSRVLVISNDYVNKKMAGPAIRSFELARELVEAGNQVTLAVPAASDLENAPMALEVYDDVSLRRLASTHDVILFQGGILERFPFLRKSGACLVADLYDPFPLELLVTVAHDPSPTLRRAWKRAMLILNEQIRQADYFLCASEKQLDYWFGALSTLSRINADTYLADPSYGSFIDIVPFGIQAEPPRRQGPGMRGVIPGVEEADLVLLWGGGVYNWFDPVTLIRGVAKASRKLPKLRLVFMAATHPNPETPEMWMLGEARRVAAELGLTGKHVFFNQEWVPYDRRADWLLDADIGVSTHFDHVETRFSFRTRILDYFWAGLPVISTAGDTLAERIEREELGRTVPPEDVDAVSEAILSLAEPKVRRQVSERVREHAAGYTWKKAAEPLVRFCANPRHAPDLASGSPAVAIRGRYQPPYALRRMRHLLNVVKEEGPRGVMQAGRRWLRRRRLVAAARVTDPGSR